MEPSSDRCDGWSAAQRWLHWAVAALVFAAFAVGLTMVALPLTRLLEKIIAYQVHKTLGLLVPPLVQLFNHDRLLAGVPQIVVYLFGVWLALILGTVVLTRHLEPDHTDSQDEGES